MGLEEELRQLLDHALVSDPSVLAAHTGMHKGFSSQEEALQAQLDMCVTIMNSQRQAILALARAMDDLREAVKRESATTTHPPHRD